MYTSCAAGANAVAAADATTASWTRLLRLIDDKEAINDDDDDDNLL
jgi:hypothetical protein